MAGGAWQIYCSLLTEVVFTPQSKSWVMGEGAGGVSTHSKFSSEVLLLILHLAGEFCKTQSRDVESCKMRAVSLSEAKAGELVLLQLAPNI